MSSFLAREAEILKHPNFIELLQELTWYQAEATRSCVPITLILGVGRLGHKLACYVNNNLCRLDRVERYVRQVVLGKSWPREKDLLLLNNSYEPGSVKKIKRKEILLIVPEMNWPDCTAPKEDYETCMIALRIRENGHAWARRQLRRYGYLQEVVTVQVPAIFLEALLYQEKLEALLYQEKKVA